MHGPLFTGDGAAALTALADDYDRRLDERIVARTSSRRRTPTPRRTHRCRSAGRGGEEHRVVGAVPLHVVACLERRVGEAGLLQALGEVAAHEAVVAFEPLAVEAAVAGSGVIYLFEDWLRPHLDRGALEPVLEPWWQRFPGPFLYYPGRRYLPAPLRAFVDFVRALG